MMLKRGAIFTLMASLLVSSLMVSSAYAVNEVSRLVPFQGRLHGTDNKAVADGVYDLTFNIYDTPTGGTPAWSEAHTQVSVIHGYVNILLGAITPMHDDNYGEVTATPAYDASKNKVDFTAKKFLGISINGGVEMFPRSQLVPTFHAFTANHADHATNADHALQADEASNTVKLNNQSASYYATSSSLSSSTSRVAVLEANFSSNKANDSNKLDNLDSSEFQRIAAQEPSTADPNTTTKGLILTIHANSPSTSVYWHIKTTFWSSIGGNAAQHAISYNGSPSKSYVRHRYGGTWEPWVRTDNNGKSADSDKLDGLNSSDFLRNTGIATNANLLDGLNSSDFLRNTGTAANATLLDGLNSTDFLRNTGKAVDSDKLDGKDASEFTYAKRNVYFGSNDNNITTAQFISLLDVKGAFSVPHWVAKGAWSYGGNQNITDTGFISSLELAGAVVEVFNNNNTTYTIRITGGPTGGAANRIFEYINHGSGYVPKWKEIVTNLHGKAYDADKLDGLNSSDFVRSTHLTDLVPVGTVLIWPTSTLPVGYEHCNGQPISKTTYPELFAIIGYQYGGSGDSFNVPDYRGYFLRGWANGSATDPNRASRAGGDTVGSTQADELKSHKHGLAYTTDSSIKEGLQTTPGAANDHQRATSHVTDEIVKNTGGNETRPINRAVMYVIKTRTY